MDFTIVLKHIQVHMNQGVMEFSLLVTKEQVDSRVKGFLSLFLS